MELATGFPGYNSLMSKSAGTFAEVLKQNGFMSSQARRGQAETGVVLPVTDAEAFLCAYAQAGVVQILQ